MKPSSPTYLLLALIFSFTTLLFVGQFYDPFDSDRRLFVKHRPSFRQYFYSPNFQHRYLPHQFSMQELQEEIAFLEFRKDMFDNVLPILPIVLIQQSLTFLLAALYAFVFKRPVTWWLLFAQFISTIAFTALLITFMVFADEALYSVITSGVVLVLNLATFFAGDKIVSRFSRKKSHSIGIEPI